MALTNRVLANRALDVRPVAAKAGLHASASIHPWRAVLGGAIKRARARKDWSLKQLAASLDRDERQVARWEDGSERAHWDALFAIDDFRIELLIALAEVCGSAVEIETTVRIPR